MREINVGLIKDAVRDLCIKANIHLPGDVRNALIEARQSEVSPLAGAVLDKLMENWELAEREEIPLCQDCGLAVFFVEIGQEVHMVGGGFNDAINRGVREGYEKGFLRKSVVRDPVFDRINTGDNTPAVVYTEIVPGDRIRIIFLPKGAGSENMSRLGMLAPAAGSRGIRDFVVKAVDEAGANPCPPVIIGVGIGGTADRAMQLAKKALIRELGTGSEDGTLKKLEQEILEEINSLGIGPQGLGGSTTALGVNIESCPCHMASLPVAVNIQCHCARHGERII